MNIAEKIYQLRKIKGCSQEELAAELGVSRQAVSKWEAGSSLPDTDKLLRLSTFFDVSVDELLKDIDSGNPKSLLRKKPRYIFPLILCGVGTLGMAILFLLSLFNSMVSDPIAETVSFHFNVYAIICALLALMFMVGTVIFSFLHFSTKRS